MQYTSASEIFDEFTSLTPSYHGLTYEKLGATGKLYPCPDPDRSDGTVVMFDESFPTATGRARFVADELPDEQYPFVLVTGRVLEHWHTGVMTRRSKALSAIAPEAFVEIHPQDCEKLGIENGQFVTVTSRRGFVTLQVRESSATQRSSVFIPFHFREASANVLTNEKLDPDGKIPELKFCAVRVDAA